MMATRIDYEIHFIEPMESTDFAYMTFTSPNDLCNFGKMGVSWRDEVSHEPDAACYGYGKDVGS